MAQRQSFADIGPRTKKLAEVRDGVRGISRALDRGACRDAAALLRLTEREAAKLNILDDDTRSWLREEKQRFQKSCSVNLARRTRRRRRRTRR